MQESCLGSFLLLGGWALLNVLHREGPGLVWTSAHVLLLVGYVLLLLGALGMYGQTGKGTGPISAILRSSGVGMVVVGTMAFFGQLAIDLVVGFLAHDQAGMDRLFDSVQSHLAVQLFCYSVGPALFYVGLLLLVALYTRARLVARWAGVLVMAGIGLIGISFMLGEGTGSPLYPLGLLCMVAGFLPMLSRPKTA